MRKEPKITSTKEDVKVQTAKFKDTATAFWIANNATTMLNRINRIKNGIKINSFD